MSNLHIIKYNRIAGGFYVETENDGVVFRCKTELEANTFCINQNVLFEIDEREKLINKYVEKKLPKL
jgi:hypothetical protein